MNDEPHVFDAMTKPETKALQAGLSLCALAFAAATILDMHPTLAIPRRMRTAAEQHGSVVFAYPNGCGSISRTRASGSAR